MQPINVLPNSQDFEIVAGARRFRAASLRKSFLFLPTSWKSTMPGARIAARRRRTSRGRPFDLQLSQRHMIEVPCRYP